MRLDRSLIGILGDYDTGYYYPEAARQGQSKGTFGAHHQPTALAYRDESCPEVMAMGVAKCTSCPLPACNIKDSPQNIPRKYRNANAGRSRTGGNK